MTSFGQKVRQLRSSRGIALKAMAHEIGISLAYLSASRTWSPRSADVVSGAARDRFFQCDLGRVGGT